MNRITDKDEIINFLRGYGGDHLGRTLNSHWSISDEEMERCHDRIQWLFPLHEDSKHSSNFPIITHEIVEEAKKYPEIEQNLIKSTEFFLTFLGVLDGSLDDFLEGRQTNYPLKGEWCKNRDHNLLRITRMLRSLRLFGLDALSMIIFSHFVSIGINYDLSDVTLEYWSKAAQDDEWSTLQ